MPGFVHRRRYKTVVYPATIEDYVADGKYLRDGYREDYAGFSARMLASPNGAEERALSQAYFAFELARRPKRDDEGTIVEKIDPDRLQAAREDYLREVAWRIPEWNLEDENRDGELVTVPAPGESDDNWEALDVLPNTVMWWLIEEVRTAHLPDPLLPVAAGTTGTPTPTSTAPETTPREVSAKPPATDSAP